MIEHWLVLPASAMFGFLSMLFGIGVAPMFLPFLILVEQVPLGAAIAATLIIEVFGFSAALISFIRKGSIAYPLAVQILLHTVPAAVIGVIISASIPVFISMTIFSLLLVIIAALIIHPEHEILYRRDEPSTGYVTSEFGLARNISLIGSTLAGLLAGITSTGIGEINNYIFLKKFKMPGEMATATSMFIIAITAFIAAGAHGFKLFMHEPEILFSVARIIVLGSVGIILGVLMGDILKISIPDTSRERYVAAILLALGVLGFVTLLV
jgi:uncharacterized membrane protein YfcA